MAISKGDRQRVIQLVEQLPDESLSEVIDLLNNLLRQTRQSQPLISSNSEELLLQVMGRRLLPDDQARLDYLREQNESGDITEAEHQELLDFVSRVENEDAERVAAILQLAQNQVEVDDWQYLAKRNHPWRKQLYVKGQKLLASTVWQDMIANEMSVEEAAENWDLPLDAINEIIRYCESHQDLLKLEADEEYYHLVEKGVSFESKVAA
ncbi:hypothetical protein APA_4710 [Pseudanabaena sp. lw0831]|uniref:hypothetical protein n=1 Tax=Pseudanabaena sp. lw0831 TaxID=1357935 RepID=UPI001A27326C|nr:hypothetical protein [Pseudanabaena sp. lw0831]GBO56374.1 hypothetical protein APA_4710 [Pseudanabaena sp. lw0831]